MWSDFTKLPRTYPKIKTRERFATSLVSLVKRYIWSDLLGGLKTVFRGLCFAPKLNVNNMNSKFTSKFDPCMERALMLFSLECHVVLNCLQTALPVFSLGTNLIILRPSI